MNVSARLPITRAAWIAQGTLAQSSQISVAINNTTMYLGITYQGSATPKKLGVMCAGFGVDGRCFAKSFQHCGLTEEGDTALMSIALIGAGASVPKELRLSPEVISEIYAKAIHATAPNAESIAILGNSMGALFALGAVLELKTQHNVSAHFLSDNGATWDALGSMQSGHWLGECRTVLHRTLALAARASSHLLAGALWVSFRVPLLNRLMNAWFARTLYSADATAADRAHLRTTLAATGMPHQRSAWSVLATAGSDYLGNIEASLFPKNTNVPIQLPAGATVLYSDRDAVFNQGTAQKFADGIRAANDSRVEIQSTQGPHLETTPRAWDAIRDALQKNLGNC